MASLTYRERSASGHPEGLLFLHHGRGTDENDLLPLADALDPGRRLQVVSPRGPLTLPGWPGSHWYAVPRVGFPDPKTFRSAFGALTRFHDEIWEQTGISPQRTVLGGFSMGAVMSYATGLSGQRPRPAGILAFSGFIPTVEGWNADIESRRGLPVLIAHGRADPIIDVSFAHSARDLLEAGGLDVTYLESDVVHTIDPAHLDIARAWLAAALTAA
jgi:phospholipase/carboxylesterase